MPPQHTDLLLPKWALLAITRSSPHFASIATIITGTTDHQSVACAEDVFCNPNFVEAVAKAGFPEAALTMHVFGRAYLASDQRGLEIQSVHGCFMSATFSSGR